MLSGAVTSVEMPRQAAPGPACASTLVARLLIVAVAAWAMPVQPASAQPSAAPGRVDEVAPELFYLEDDGGRLVPVPGFRYRDFVDLLRLKEGLPGLPETPAAVLERITVRVDMAGAAAGGGCPVTAEIVVRQVRPGWASVPLELGDLMLTGSVGHQGQGRILLTAEPPGGSPNEAPRRGRGYRMWLEGTGTSNAPADDRHTIALEGRVAVESSAAHESLEIQLPAATASLLELRTPRVDPIVTVHPRAVQPQVERTDTGSLVTLVGLSGPTRVRLAERESGGAASGRVPQAVVESLVRVDGKVAVIDAALRVEGLPPGVSALRIGLPQRSTIRSVRPPSTLVEPAAADKPGSAVVRIDRDSEGRAVVEMECERPIDASGRNPFEPLGFAVADVAPWRQSGRVSIVVEGDWQVEWDDPVGSRRVDPPAAARRPGFVAAFAYDAQPASLPLRVRPRGSRVVIEPDYRYDVGATRIGLTATLRVSVRGAPASRIIVGLDGWNVEEVGPAAIVDAAAVSAEGGRLIIPFMQGLTGDAIVEVRAGRAIERSAARVGWRMPVPQADLVGQATVVIATESDVELLPDAAAIRGLTREVAPAPQATTAERIALAYRMDGAEGTFAADRRFLPRRVDATVATQIDVGDAATTVRETMRFSVAHVPMEYVDLLVPGGVMESGGLEVRQDGRLLNPVGRVAPEEGQPSGSADSAAAAVEEEAAGEGPRETANAGGLRSDSVGGLRGDSTGWPRVRYLLAMPLLGDGDITVRYEMPLPAVPPETTVAEDLRLVMPAGVTVGRQTLLVAAAEPLSIDVRGDAWKRDVSAHSAVPSRLWTAARAQESVPLTLSARRRLTSGEIVVDATWMETRLLPDRRDDAFTYSITSTGDRIAMDLPTGLSATAGQPGSSGVDVRLDGRPQPAAVRPDGSIVIDLPRDAGRGAWLLEIRVSRPRAGRGPSGLPAAVMPASIVLDPPSFPAGTVQRRFYWEVRLETDEHVVVPPGRWASQQRWEWTPLGPEWLPIVSREVLDGWVRAGTEAARDAGGRLPRRRVDVPVAERRVVYSGVGPPGAVRIWLAPSWMLVLGVSGPVLAAGLAMVYRPWLRRVPVVTGVGACLAVAAALLPDVAPWVAKAALPGLALSMLAAFLRFFVERATPADRAGRRPQAAVVSASSLTRTMPPPSLIVASSSLRPTDSVTAPGRSGR